MRDDVTTALPQDTGTLIRQPAHDLTLPDHACGSWRSLYGGTATLLDEWAVHIALKDNVLFLRIEPAA